MAARISGKDDVALTYFGDGATSTGAFHVACNFAAVRKAPCLFLCRNNGWAISAPQVGADDDAHLRPAGAGLRHARACCRRQRRAGAGVGHRRGGGARAPG